MLYQGTTPTALAPSSLFVSFIDKFFDNDCFFFFFFFCSFLSFLLINNAVFIVAEEDATALVATTIFDEHDIFAQLIIQECILLLYLGKTGGTLILSKSDVTESSLLTTAVSLHLHIIFNMQRGLCAV